MKNIDILYMKQKTIRKEMKSKNRSNKTIHTSKNKTKRYNGAGQGSSKSKKVEFEMMTTVEKVSEIKKMAKSVKKMAKSVKKIPDFYIPEDESLKEILKSIHSLRVDKGNIVEKEELMNLLYRSMENILNNKPSTVDKPPTPSAKKHSPPRPTQTVTKKPSPPRPTPTVAKKPSSVHDDVEHIEKMRQKLDDILSGEIQKFGFNEVREILQYMSNVDKIYLIKRMKPKLGNMLNTDLTTMKSIDELLSLLHTLGIPKPKGATDRRDLEIIINDELNKVGSNTKIDELFVDVLNKLVKERDEKHKEEEKKHKEAMKKYEEDVKKYNEDMKKYNQQQEQIRLAEEKKKHQEQVQDMYGTVWNKSIHTDGKPYYWDALTGESVWVLPGQVPPPPPVYNQNQGYTYVYDPYTVSATAYQAEAERQLRSIPPHLRHGDKYNPKTFDDLPNNTWR